MESNSEKLAYRLAELRKREQTKKAEAILSIQEGATLKGFVGGEILEKANEFWRLFSYLDYKPFSTLPGTSDAAPFNQWVIDCYQKAGSPNPVLVNIGGLYKAELAEVEIHSIEAWVENLKNYLTSHSMGFDILLLTTSADVALELWEDEYHYLAFLFKPDMVIE